MVECIKCKHVLKEPYESGGMKCTKITCNNINSPFYKKSVITSKAFPTVIYAISKLKSCDDYEEKSSDNAKIKVLHSKGSLVIENARDRFANLLNSSKSDTFESIVTEYIHRYGNTISADECCQIINILSDIQYAKIANLNNIKRVSKEHATYLKLFLEGKMYTDNDNWDKYKDKQKENAQAIIDACDNK